MWQSAKGANANGKSVSPAPKAGATEKKQVFKDLLASNWVRKSKDDGATPAKKSADSKDILTYSQTPDEESEDKQKLADALVNLKTAYIGDKNVRSHAKVTKMVSRFWKVTRKIKLEGADEATQSQTQQSNTGAPPVLHSLLKDKKAGIFLIKRPVVDQKHLDQDVMALQLLALASEAAEVGALSEDMMTDLAQLSIVFIHCSSLSRPGDMERLVNDPLLNRLRVEAPHVRFIVFGMRFTGAEKTPTGVFEPIFDSRASLSSNLLLGCVITMLFQATLSLSPLK